MKIEVATHSERLKMQKILNVDLTDINIIAFHSFKGVGLVAILNYYIDTDIELYVWGTGAWLNKKLLKYIFTYVFNQLNCKRVSARIESKNIKSINLVERLGFVKEGELRGINTYLYSLLKEDCTWAENQKVT